MRNTDEQLTKRFFELSDRAQERQCAVFSEFLNIDEQSALLGCEASKNVFLYGGYPSAERKIACFGCSDLSQTKEDFPARLLKIEPSAPKFADELTHRDFLGTLMGLGLRRETIGDIVIFDNTGYVFCLPKIADYIIENVERIKRTSVKCSIVPSLPSQAAAEPTEQTVIVPSERLDALVAAVYHLSRSSAQRLFKEGKVFVNSRQTDNISYSARGNDIISVRGSGRFIFCGISGETKKARLKAVIKVF